MSDENDTKVVQLDAYRKVKHAIDEDPGYELRLSRMDKLQLLDEMVRFQEERSARGELSLPLMVRGRVLFEALERVSETKALRALTRSYRRHLEHELQHYLSRNS